MAGAGVIVAAGAFVYLGPEHPASPKQQLVDASKPALTPMTDAGTIPARSSSALGVAPVAPSAQPLSVPSADILVMLIRSSLLALGQANKAGNYSVLRELAAPQAQDATTPARFSEAFAPLRAANVDLGPIAVTDPSLSAPPTVGRDGVLRLTGFFPSKQGQVDFSLAYGQVRGRWSALGMTVNPPKAGTPAANAAPSSANQVPDDSTLITLIRSVVLSLNQANATGDYAVLRETAATGFRDANSLDKLAATFAALRGRQLDLSPVAVIAPRLFKKAAIDGNGYLRLTGYFPSHPEQVNFDLAFKYEDGEWRLFGIGLNTSVEVGQNGAASGAAVSGK
jgi:hypothetical protein